MVVEMEYMLNKNYINNRRRFLLCIEGNCLFLVTYILSPLTIVKLHCKNFEYSNEFDFTNKGEEILSVRCKRLFL